MLRACAICVLAGALAACSSGGHAPVAPGAAAPAHATTNALAGTPMAGYGHDLDKAKNVQTIVDRQAQKQAAQIEAATGSTSD